MCIKLLERSQPATPLFGFSDSFQPRDVPNWYCLELLNMMLVLIFLNLELLNILPTYTSLSLY